MPTILLTGASRGLGLEAVRQYAAVLAPWPAQKPVPTMRGSGSSVTPKRSRTDAATRRATDSSCSPVAWP